MDSCGCIYMGNACFINNGFCIVPNDNLVSNIGFGTDSTHTTDLNSSLSNLQRGKITYPLLHPVYIVEDKIRDKIWSKNILKNKLLIDRVKNKLLFLKRIFIK